MRLHVYPDKSVLLTIPKRASIRGAEQFFANNLEWIAEKQRHFGSGDPEETKKQSREHYLRNKKAARAFIVKKVEELNSHYGFRYGKVAVRNTRTRWGSCSREGNLNFHYKILFLSEPFADYVVAHELCHLKELNHSPKFWKLVAETIPDYKEKRRELHRQRIQ